RPNLTVRLGLRDEMATRVNEKNGHSSNYLFDPNGIMRTEPLIGKSPLIENNALSLWQPRVGLAWDVTGSGKWAVRTGFGIHNDLQDNLANRLNSNPPFSGRLTVEGKPLLSIIPVSAEVAPPPSCKVAWTDGSTLHPLRTRRDRSGLAHADRPAMELDGG